MKGLAKVVKGRIEEAAGAIANNDKLRNRGQTDQAVGRINQAGEKSVRRAKGSARQMVEKARNAAKGAVSRAKDMIGK